MDYISQEDLGLLKTKAISETKCDDDTLILCFSNDYKAEILADDTFTFVRDGIHQNSGFLRNLSPQQFYWLVCEGGATGGVAGAVGAAGAE